MAAPFLNLFQSLLNGSASSKTKASSKVFTSRDSRGILQNGVLPTGMLPSGLPEIALEQVAHHDDYNDCWVVIYDRVYDVTRFLHMHPGGEDVLMDHAGRDATLAFHGTGHSKDAIEQLSDYLIGELPVKERIFRTENSKILSSGIPD